MSHVKYAFQYLSTRRKQKKVHVPVNVFPIMHQRQEVITCQTPSIYLNKSYFYVTNIFLFIYVCNWQRQKIKHNYLNISKTTKLFECVWPCWPQSRWNIKRLTLKLWIFSFFKGTFLHCGISMIAEPCHFFFTSLNMRHKSKCVHSVFNDYNLWCNLTRVWRNIYSKCMHSWNCDSYLNALMTFIINSV